MQAPSGPWLAPWGEAQRLRRSARPSPLRERAEPAPAKGRDGLTVIGFVAFVESHSASV
ncbi:hypothetical protein [Litorimonas haliclonae]|uniref:hypothetical protein n=1 Tax=Litorimonas haliclonae TaxID=2081977 RepID=UPI0039EEEE77